MKYLFLTSLLVFQLNALGVGYILKKEGLICTQNGEDLKEGLKHDVVIDIPTKCLDIPWTMQFRENTKLEDGYYDELEYRSDISFQISGHKNISCRNKDKKVQRRTKYDFTISDEAYLKIEVTDGNVFSNNGVHQAKELRSKNLGPSYQEQSLNYQIKDGKITVAEKYLDGKHTFAYETQENKNIVQWYMSKKHKEINEKALVPTKEELNFVSNLSCGDYKEVNADNIFDSDLGKDSQNDDSQPGINSSKQ